MTEKELLSWNERLRQRQAEIRAAKGKSDAVHIGEILTGVLKKIEQRMERRGVLV